MSQLKPSARCTAATTITPAVAARTAGSVCRHPRWYAITAQATSTTRPNSTRPYERKIAIPTSSPPTPATSSRRWPAPMINKASPLVATPANSPSADTAIQTAPGKSAAKGTARRAATSAPSSRIVTGTATLAAEPTMMQSAPAQKPPPSPIRPSPQNSSVASGGCPATWVVQTTVPSTPGPNAMKCVKVAMKLPGSLILGRSCKYSFGSSSTSTHPRCRPSTRVSEHIQARFSSHPASSSRRHVRAAAIC